MLDRRFLISQRCTFYTILLHRDIRSTTRHGENHITFPRWEAKLVSIDSRKYLL